MRYEDSYTIDKQMIFFVYSAIREKFLRSDGSLDRIVDAEIIEGNAVTFYLYVRI